MVEGVEGGRFALICKTHHALVDGISGVDIVTVLFDLEPEGAGARRAGAALAAGADALGDAAALRSAARARDGPGGDRAVGARRSSVLRARSPRGVRDSLVGVGAMAWAGMNPAPPSPYNCQHRPAPALHLGADQPRRRQGHQGRARRHGQRRRAGDGLRRARQAPAPARRDAVRARAEGDGAGQRARRRGPRRARQPGGRDDGAAAGLVLPTRSVGSRS